MKKRHRISQCPNCRTQLMVNDNFCPHCGQENHFIDNSLKELWKDFIGSFINFDGKIWNTLKILFLASGKISKDFVAGKKIRYVPAARMYLFISFIYFLVMNFSVGLIINSQSVQSLLRAAKQSPITPVILQLSDIEYFKLTGVSDTDRLKLAYGYVQKDTLNTRLKFIFDNPSELESLRLIHPGNRISAASSPHSNLTIVENRSNSNYQINFYPKAEYDSLKIEKLTLTAADLFKIHDNENYLQELINTEHNSLSFTEKLRVYNIAKFYAVSRFGTLTEKKSFAENELKTILNYFSYSMFFYCLWPL